MLFVCGRLDCVWGLRQTQGFDVIKELGFGFSFLLLVSGRTSSCSISKQRVWLGVRSVHHRARHRHEASCVVGGSSVVPGAARVCQLFPAVRR